MDKLSVGIDGDIYRISSGRRVLVAKMDTNGNLTAVADMCRKDRARLAVGWLSPAADKSNSLATLAWVVLVQAVLDLGEDRRSNAEMWFVSGDWLPWAQAAGINRDVFEAAVEDYGLSPWRW